MPAKMSTLKMSYVSDTRIILFVWQHCQMTKWDVLSHKPAILLFVKGKVTGIVLSKYFHFLLFLPDAYKNSRLSKYFYSEQKNTSTLHWQGSMYKIKIDAIANNIININKVGIRSSHSNTYSNIGQL